MNPARWRLWLLAAIAAAIGLAIVMSTDADNPEPPDDEPPAAAGGSERPQRSAAAAPVRVELERLSRAPAQGEADQEPGNAFGAMSWDVAQPAEPEPESTPPEQAPAPSPPARPEPAPPPRAPALPFTYLGRYEDAETRLVMLVKGDRIHTVARGDVIDGVYRVDRIDEQQVELTYLPLDQKQSLATGGRS